MKNPERVAQLLAELRELTETPIELAVVNRCEKDLTAPPTAEIIDDEHQRFNGIIYKKNGSGHFSKDTRIHQAVWAFYHGEIPNGYQIHHIDEDKCNNSIDNLQCLSASDHQLLHWQKPRHIGAIREFTCDNCGQKYTAVDNGRNRYCPECKPKIQYAPGVRRRIYKKTCPHCHKEFETRYKESRYCSRSCALYDRYKRKSQSNS